jgi:hypothetical protein
MNLYWTGEGHGIVDFAETGDVRSSLAELRRESVEQVVQFISRVIEVRPPREEPLGIS